MKTKSVLIIFILSCLIRIQTNAQVYYHFPKVYSPAGCQYTYEIAIWISLDSVKVTNIYSDNGTTGSFAYEAYVSFRNIFTNSTLPAGDFYTYDFSIYSDNPNLSPPMLTNNAGSVPLETHTTGGLQSQNNPTFNGSASAMGLALNGVYSSHATLLELGYDSATLHINLPCLDTTMGTGNISPSPTPPGPPLPVQWSPLTAMANGLDVLLQWETYTEQNNTGFTIQRSNDAVSWQNIGLLPSQSPDGNSSGRLSYQYKLIEQQPGRYFYRVQQTDIDGRYSFSSIASLIIDGHRSNQLLVYPNPATQFIYLRQVPANTRYQVFDVNGRIVLQGNFIQRIDVSGLNAGIYWIRTGEGTGVKFVVNGE